MAEENFPSSASEQAYSPRKEGAPPGKIPADLRSSGRDPVRRGQPDGVLGDACVPRPHADHRHRLLLGTDNFEQKTWLCSRPADLLGPDITARPEDRLFFRWFVALPTEHELISRADCGAISDRRAAKQVFVEGFASS
jgi:hypothetical protein